MAKKRKKTRGSKKEAPNRQELPGGFGRNAFALSLIIVAILFVLGMLGSGEWLTAAFNGGKAIVGMAMYIVPLMMVVLAILIFKKEDHKLPVSVWAMMIVLLLCLSGLFGLPTVGEAESSGGMIGGGLNSVIAVGLGVAGAAVVYIAVGLVAISFICSKSPIAFFKWMFKRLRSKKGEDDKNELTMKKAAKADEKAGDFKINAGVTLMGDKERAAAAAAKTAAPVMKEKALVSVSDPNWKLPSSDLLETRKTPADAGNIRENSLIIKNTLSEFDIDVEMDGANVGPRVTQYTMRPANGVKLSRIMSMDRELSASLAADKIRIEAPIPGTSLVGVEIPNIRQADVSLREIIDSKGWRESSGALPFAVGKDIAGDPVIADLAKMPHLLIAGTTGSGKSVMMNTLLLSLLYRNTPADMRLIIIDPKQVEMASYSDIRHLITPIITDVTGALSALTWATKEMERRYKDMAKHRVKNIVEYNTKIEGGQIKVEVPDADGNEQRHDGGKMPYIVVVVDEMADLMMMAGKDLENLIVRVAQKGRASGIHLVLATQRPEVKVITGLIKANIPGRIAFAVGSQIDSRVMLDMNGAEKLLGRGDMLFLTTEMMGKPRRVQGAFASEQSKSDSGDIERVTNFLRDESGDPEEFYEPEVSNQKVQIKGHMGTESGGGGGAKLDDPLIRSIMEYALEQGRLSNSDVMRQFELGFQRAGRMIDNLEKAGMIGPRNGNKPRDVMISSIEEFDEKVSELG